MVQRFSLSLLACCYYWNQWTIDISYHDVSLEAFLLPWYNTYKKWIISGHFQLDGVLSCFYSDTLNDSLQSGQPVWILFSYLNFSRKKIENYIKWIQFIASSAQLGAINIGIIRHTNLDLVHKFPTNLDLVHKFPSLVRDDAVQNSMPVEYLQLTLGDVGCCFVTHGKCLNSLRKISVIVNIYGLPWRV